MGEERGEPPSPEQPSGTSGDSARDRLAGAREAIFTGLQDVALEFQASERAAREQAERRLEDLVSQRLAEAEATLRSELQAGATPNAQQLARRVEGAARTLEEHLEAAVERVRAEADSAAESIDRRLTGTFDILLDGAHTEMAANLERRVAELQQEFAESSARSTASDELRVTLSAHVEAARAKAEEELAAMVKTRLGMAERTLADRASAADARLAAEQATGLARGIETARATLDRQLGERLDAEAARLRGEAGKSLNAIEAAEARVARRIEVAAEKVSLRSRRHELKLARQESSKRVSVALERLERRAEASASEFERTAAGQRSGLEASAKLHREALERLLDDGSKGLRSQLDSRAEELGARAAAGDERVAAALARLNEGVQRVEDAVAGIAESERRVEAVCARVADLARNADEATDVEARLRAATAVEEEAARRIREAEERLRRAVDDEYT